MIFLKLKSIVITNKTYHTPSHVANINRYLFLLYLLYLIAFINAIYPFILYTYYDIRFYSIEDVKIISDMF